MCRGLAPTAMRTPISRVRSVTLTSMMFMMPMPPTSSDTAAMLASSRVSASLLSCLRDAVSVRFLIVKSSSPPARCRGDRAAAPRSCRLTRGGDVVGRDLDQDRARDELLQAALDLREERRHRDVDDVVVVVAARRLALAAAHAHHLERDVGDAHGLADRIGAGAEQVGRRRSGPARRSWRRASTSSGDSTAPRRAGQLRISKNSGVVPVTFVDQLRPRRRPGRWRARAARRSGRRRRRRGWRAGRPRSASATIRRPPWRRPTSSRPTTRSARWSPSPRRPARRGRARPRRSRPWRSRPRRR